jgi:hypothetical protein
MWCASHHSTGRVHPGNTHPPSRATNAAHCPDVTVRCSRPTRIGTPTESVMTQVIPVRLIAEADGRDLGRRKGAASTPAWLRDWFRLRPADAKWQLNVANRIAAAADGGPVDYAANVNGPPTGREMPATGAALAAGEISEQHAVVVAKAMAKLPTTLAPEAAAEAERQLAAYARQFDPAALAKLADCLVDALLPETLEDDEEDAVNKRELRFSDLTGRLSGRLDPEGLALVRAMLDPLAAPRSTADGEKDDRSPARRLADALVEIARRVLNQGEWLPAEHGNRPHLMLISEFGTDGCEGAGADRADGSEGRDRGDGADGGSDADAATNSDGAAAADSGANDRTAPGVPAPPAAGSAEVSPEPARLAGHLGRGELTWGRPLSAASVRRIACDAAAQPAWPRGARIHRSPFRVRNLSVPTPELPERIQPPHRQHSMPPPAGGRECSSTCSTCSNDSGRH